MTIIEIEQALRNMIASQPMLSSGPSGEVVAGIANTIEAYKNLAYKTSLYPNQDAFKVMVATDCAKLENDICTYAVNVLQERGLNILLYLPQTVPGYTSPLAQFGLGGTTLQNQDLVMGKMVYSEAPLTEDIKPQTVEKTEKKHKEIKPETVNVDEKQDVQQNQEINNEQNSKTQEMSEEKEQKLSEDNSNKDEKKELQEEPVNKISKELQEEQTKFEEQQEENINDVKLEKKEVKKVVPTSSSGRDYLVELLKK